MKLVLVQKVSGKNIELRNNSIVRLYAAAQEQYHLVDMATGKTPYDLIIGKKGTDLILYSKEANIEISVENFWGLQNPGDGCYLIFDRPQGNHTKYVFNSDDQLVISQDVMTGDPILSSLIGNYQSANLNQYSQALADLHHVPSFLDDLFYGIPSWMVYTGVAGVVGITALGLAASKDKVYYDEDATMAFHVKNLNADPSHKDNHQIRYNEEHFLGGDNTLDEDDMQYGVTIEGRDPYFAGSKIYLSHNGKLLKATEVGGKGDWSLHLTPRELNYIRIFEEQGPSEFIISATQKGGTQLYSSTIGFNIDNGKGIGENHPGEVYIEGVIKEGEELHLKIKDPDNTKRSPIKEGEVKWYVDGVEVEHKEDDMQAYVVKKEDAGKEIKAVVMYVDGLGHKENHVVVAKDRSGKNAMEDFSDDSANANHATDGDVVIKGEPKVGNTLKAEVKGAENSDAEVNYQWYRDGKAIEGAHGSEYELTRQDADSEIKVVATYKNKAEGNSIDVGGESTPITIKGDQEHITDGVELKVVADDAAQGSDVSVQWYRDGKAIEGANSDTYVVKATDKGHAIYAKVVVTDSEGNQEVHENGVFVANDKYVGQNVVKIDDLGNGEHVASIDDPNVVTGGHYEWFVAGPDGVKAVSEESISGQRGEKVKVDLDEGETLVASVVFKDGNKQLDHAIGNLESEGSHGRIEIQENYKSGVVTAKIDSGDDGDVQATYSFWAEGELLQKGESNTLDLSQHDARGKNIIVTANFVDGDTGEARTLVETTTLRSEVAGDVEIGETSQYYTASLAGQEAYDVTYMWYVDGAYAGSGARLPKSSVLGKLLSCVATYETEDGSIELATENVWKGGQETGVNLADSRGDGSQDAQNVGEFIEIVGDVQAGSTIEANINYDAKDLGEVGYQWYVDGNPVESDGSKLLIKDEYVGKDIQVEAFALDNAGEQHGEASLFIDNAGSDMPKLNFSEPILDLSNLRTGAGKGDKGGEITVNGGDVDSLFHADNVGVTKLGADGVKAYLVNGDDNDTVNLSNGDSIDGSWVETVNLAIVGKDVYKEYVYETSSDGQSMVNNVLYIHQDINVII